MCVYGVATTTLSSNVATTSHSTVDSVAFTNDDYRSTEPQLIADTQSTLPAEDTSLLEFFVSPITDVPSSLIQSGEYIMHLQGKRVRVPWMSTHDID